MGRDKQIDDTSINPLPDRPERHTAAHFQNATYTDIKQPRVETTMNNTSTETTTGSTDRQGSVHRRSKLYGGIAALVVIAAAVAAASRLWHEAPVSAAATCTDCQCQPAARKRTSRADPVPWPVLARRPGRAASAGRRDAYLYRIHRWRCGPEKRSSVHR